MVSGGYVIDAGKEVFRLNAKFGRLTILVLNTRDLRPEFCV